VRRVRTSSPARKGWPDRHGPPKVLVQKRSIFTAPRVFWGAVFPRCPRGHREGRPWDVASETGLRERDPALFPHDVVGLRFLSETVACGLVTTRACEMAGRRGAPRECSRFRTDVFRASAGLAGRMKTRVYALFGGNAPVSPCSVRPRSPRFAPGWVHGTQSALSSPSSTSFPRSSRSRFRTTSISCQASIPVGVGVSWRRTLKLPKPRISIPSPR
jgi:hypothetical protein